MILAGDRSKYTILPIGDKGSSGLARQFADIMHNSITDVVIPMNFYVSNNFFNIFNAVTELFSSFSSSNFKNLPNKLKLDKN